MTDLETLRRIAGRDPRYLRHLPPGVEPIAPTTPAVQTPARNGKVAVNRTPLECASRLPETGETLPCKTCGNKETEVPVFGCMLHGTCTLDKLVAGTKCCRICNDRTAKKPFAPLPGDGRIRVGLTMPVMGVGGIERFCGTMAKSLDPARFQVVGFVACLTEPFDSKTELQRLGPIGFGQEAFAALARGCDVLVCSSSQQATEWLPPDATCKLVAVSHGVGDWTARAVGWSRAADACVAVAPCSVETFPPAVRSRVTVLWNCADVKEPTVSREEQRRQWRIDPAKRVVGLVSRWSPEKRPELALDMMEHLPRDFVLVCVGPYQERAVPEVRRRGLAGRVVLAGTTEEPHNAIAALDWLVLPSLQEGFPLVACEAWALGTPLVATPVGIIPEQPRLSRVVPFDCHGRDLAYGVLTDAADVDGTRTRVELARGFARSYLTPERFGREWGELVGGVHELSAASGGR